MEFKVGDCVTWSLLPDLGVGTVIAAEGTPDTQVTVRFDKYVGYDDTEMEDGEQDHHTPYAKDLTLANGGWTKEGIQKAAFKRTEDSFALSKDWDERTDFSEKVNDALTEVGRVLISKNQSYGDSALNPVRVFSKSDTQEQLKVRIDDKLSRVHRGSDYGEDTITDLIGYLVLLKIAEGK